MPLREEFERSGNWLFRHRSYLPLVLLVIVVPALRDADATPTAFATHWWWLGCLAIGLFGLAIRAVTIGYAPGGTSGRNTSAPVAESLNTTGMYSLVRHPLYVGNYFMWLGPALCARSWSVTAIVTLAFWLYYERIMFAEEEYLRRTFGEAHEHWAASTRAFIPRFSDWRPPTAPFSLRCVLRREHSGLFALIAMLAALQLIGTILATGAPALEPWSSWTLAVGLGSYVALFSLKRYTRILHVDGR